MSPRGPRERAIYADHAATTPMWEEARQAMLPFLGPEFGNPSSLHSHGRRVAAALDEARECVASALGCEFGEVIFTSSGTESANLAILGLALANPDPRRNRVILGAAEHHCVIETRGLLERLGYRVEFAEVDRWARVDLEALEPRLAEDVLLVAAMQANNEFGTVQGVAPIAERAHEAGATFFCDAVQSFGKVPFSASSLGADLLAISAHKVGGPKGAAALYVRAGVRLQPLTVGGGQERELRAGTPNVAGIVGFAAAIRSFASSAPRSDAARSARDAFVRRLLEARPDGLRFTTDHGPGVLPGFCHLRFEGVAAESVLVVLDQLGVSAGAGAACSSGSLEPSHVMQAAGLTAAESKEGLRFSFGHSNSEQDGVEAAARLVEAIATVRRAARHSGRL